MRLLLIALVAHFGAAGLFALDTVVVDSGDELHGEVEKLEAGKLFLKTSYAGTIQVAWSKVVDVDTNAEYQVETETGRRFRGLVQRTGGATSVVVEDVKVDLDSPDVVHLVRMVDRKPPGFWETLKGSIGVGYSFTRGNSQQTQSSLAAEGSYRRDNFELKSDLNSIFSKQEEAEATSRHALNTRYDRFLTPRAFAFALSSFERNDRQLLDLRSRLGGGFGWKVEDSRKASFDLLGGVTYSNEQFRQEDGEMQPRQSTGEGLLGFEWQSTRLWGVRLTTRLTAHPNLVQTGRYRIEYDSSARVPLVAGFSWKVSLFDRFDSDPPSNDVQRNDYGMASTLGFSF